MPRSVLIHLVLFLLITSSTSLGNTTEPIKIASIFSHTGVAAAPNFHVQRGVRFAVEEINNRGGILACPIELVEIDNRSTPIGSKVAADRAVRENVTAIIGASWSSHSLAVAKVAQANGIPMIAPDSTNSAVTRVGDYIFRACFTDPFQGQVMARFAAEDLSARTAVMFVNVASNYSMGLAESFQAGFESLGGTVLKQIHYEHEQNSYRNEVAAAMGLSADVIYVPGHDDESARILMAARHAKLSGIPIGTDGWSTESFFLKGGRRVPQGYYCAHWSKDLRSPKSMHFVATYQQQGASLSTEVLGYDAMCLMADAIHRAGTTNRIRIRDALAATRDFEGVSGRISFDENGDPVKPAVIMEIIDGQPRFVKQVAP
jgi:branched-chain amino acid transport system substrate-binding protein